MIERVWRLIGTFGRPGIGSECGSAPLSPTVGTESMPKPTVTAVITTIATRGDGITLLIRGKSRMIASPPATRA